MQKEQDDNIKKATHVMHSIRFKTWLYFFFMSIFILILLFLSQLFFFSFSFNSFKTDELERVGKALIESYLNRRDNGEFAQFVKHTALTSGMEISFFRVHESPDETAPDIDELFSSVSAGGGVLSYDKFDEMFFSNFGPTNAFAKSCSIEGRNYIIFGVQDFDSAGPGEVYLYMSTPVNVNDLTTSVIKRQSAMSIIICVLLSLVLSWFISSRIAGPVTDFSKTARKLAKGDYTVRFFGNGVSEIEDLAETLNYATEEIAKTEQLRRELLANVSHDLRTPLTMVKAYAEMIRDFPENAAAKRSAHSQVIIDEADRLTNLVNDIQNLSKLQSGTEEMEMSEVDLASTARIVLERFDMYANKLGFTFINKIEEDCTILADEKRIEQVIYNLLGNAINYTGEDKTITVYVKKNGDSVYFGVKDTGKGIRPEEIKTVWERYYRAGQTKRTHVGTGLGLSIVKNILESHNARYGIESTVGEGSLFWFSLPSKESVERKALETTENDGKKRKHKKSGPKNHGDGSEA